MIRYIDPTNWIDGATRREIEEERDSEAVAALAGRLEEEWTAEMLEEFNPAMVAKMDRPCFETRAIEQLKEQNSEDE